MIGQTLGHYRIVEKIGAGGMGVVYHAHDEQLDRDIALKVLPPGTLVDETARQRFRQEALALSRLNHPHICTIYEIGEAEGQTYIAMEFVEGRQLSALVRGEGLPVETAARYGAQIADALAHAHERGVIHRDLKSANVIITPEGRAKVLDFGLAKRAVEREAEATRTEGLTEAGTVVGTLHYMAPEALRGETADARSDVWALGVMLYEMAAGALPFQGKTGFDVSSAILRDSPAPLPARVPAGAAGGDPAVFGEGARGAVSAGERGAGGAGSHPAGLGCGSGGPSAAGAVSPMGAGAGRTDAGGNRRCGGRALGDQIRRSADQFGGGAAPRQSFP